MLGRRLHGDGAGELLTKTLLALLLLALPAAASAQAVMLTDTLVAPAGSREYGYAVASDGTRILVGSTTGGAWIYEHTSGSWTLAATLAPFGGVSSRDFGTFVDIDGDYAFVGAPGADSDGFVFVYHRTGATWTGAQILSESPVSPGGATALFGGPIRSQGTTLAVGAFYYDRFGANMGRVVVFVRDASSGNYTQTAMLQAPTMLGGEVTFFGAAMDFHAPYLIASDWADNHVYTWQVGATGTTLTAVSARTYATGMRVQQLALDTNLALLGAWGEAGGGAAYFASTVDGSIMRRATASGGAEYGASVATEGAWAAVGSRGNYAVVHHRSGSTWSDVTTLRDVTTSGAFFGQVVSVIGDQLIVTAPFTASSPTGSGRVLVYRLCEITCTTTPDAGTDGGMDAGTDAAVVVVDAGTDGGMDAGIDGGADAGMEITTDADIDAAMDDAAAMIDANLPDTGADAGRDAAGADGSAADGATHDDAGTRPRPELGCTCTIAGGTRDRTRGLALLAFGLVLALAVRRRA